MIDIRHRVTQVVFLHRWYTEQLDAANLAAIACASIRTVPSAPRQDTHPLLVTIENQMSEVLTRMFGEASTDAISSILGDDYASVSSETKAFLSELRNAYLMHIKTVVLGQLRNDARQAIKRYRDFWLGVDLEVHRNGSTRCEAIVSERERLLAKESIRLDRAGRAWKSSRYIQVEVMQALTGLHNATALNLMIQRNIEEAEVYNPGSRHHGKRFYTRDYREVEAKYFHPNSAALVTNIIY